MTTTRPKGSVYQDLMRLDLLKLARRQCACNARLIRTIIDAIDLLSHSDSSAALSVLLASQKPLSSVSVAPECPCGAVELARLFAAIAGYAHAVRDEDDEDVIPEMWPVFSHREVIS